MITERIPCQFGNHSMILMQIISVVGENQVWRDNPFQFFEISFDIARDIGEKTVGEIFDDDVFRSGLLQEQVGAVTRFGPSLILGTENDPINSRLSVRFKQCEDRSSATYFDVVTMCTQAQNTQRCFALFSACDPKH